MSFAAELQPQGTTIDFLQNIKRSMCEIICYRTHEPNCFISKEIFGTHVGNGWKIDMSPRTKVYSLDIHVIITTHHVYFNNTQRNSFYARFYTERGYLYVPLLRDNEAQKLKELSNNALAFPPVQQTQSREQALDYHIFFVCGRGTNSSNSDEPHIGNIPGIWVDTEQPDDHPTSDLFVGHIPSEGSEAMISHIRQPKSKIVPEVNGKNRLLRGSFEAWPALDYKSFGTIKGSSGGPLICGERVIGIHRAGNCGIMIKDIMEDLVRNNIKNTAPMLRFSCDVSKPEFILVLGCDRASQGNFCQHIEIPQRSVDYEFLEKWKSHINKAVAEMEGKLYSCDDEIQHFRSHKKKKQSTSFIGMICALWHSEPRVPMKNVILICFGVLLCVFVQKVLQQRKNNFAKFK